MEGEELLACAALGQHAAFGIGGDAAAGAEDAADVRVENVHLVGDGVGASEDQFLFAVGSAGVGGLDDDLGAHPGEGAGDLRYPAVVADRQAEAAHLGDVEGDVGVAGHGGLVRHPGEDLAVRGHHFTLRGNGDGRVVDALGRPLRDAAGDDPQPGVGREPAHRVGGGARDRFGEAVEVAGRMAGVEAAEGAQVQLGEDHQVDGRGEGFEGAHLAAELRECGLGVTGHGCDLGEGDAEDSAHWRAPCAVAAAGVLGGVSSGGRSPGTASSSRRV